MYLLRLIEFVTKRRTTLKINIVKKLGKSWTFQIVPNIIFYQQKRFRGKINIQKPRAPHYLRNLVNQFMMPFYLSPNKDKELEELCHKAINATKRKELGEVANPYQRIIAREVRNWFDNSKLVAICHQNSMTMEEVFELRVSLKKANMYYKQYSKKIMKLALNNSPYTATLPLYKTSHGVVFGSDTNVTDFQKIVKKFPQVILLAGILEGQLLSRDDFLRYGKMDLTTSRMHLIQLLQNAGGNNLNQQLTYHQSTLVARLKQIGTNETTSGENEESVPV